MIPLQESAGDKTLYKLIIYKIPLIHGVDEDMYDDTLKAYLYIEPYAYNIATRETDDRLTTHYDMIREIPKQICRNEESLIQGKTDWFNNQIRLCLWSNINLLSRADRTYLQRLTHADRVSK